MSSTIQFFGVAFIVLSIACDEQQLRQVHHPEPAYFPAPMELATHGPLFTVDTDVSEVPCVTHGAQHDLILFGRLSSPGGKRELVIRFDSGKEHVVAASAWNLPAVLTVGGDRQKLVVCWNRLIGAEGPHGGMPHPATGVALVCRSGQLRAEEIFIDAESIAPVQNDWLTDVTESGGQFRVEYLHTSSGWLVAGNLPEDGNYSRSITGREFGPPTQER